jgi:hypothetical protein
MNINTETISQLISLATVISLIIIFIDMAKRIETLENTLPRYIDKLVKNNNALLKSNNALYKKVDKLSETNARNEMEKEDDKSFINKLMYCVKTNNENITILFENTEINDAKIRDIEEKTQKW